MGFPPTEILPHYSTVAVATHQRLLCMSVEAMHNVLAMINAPAGTEFMQMILKCPD